MVYFNRKFECRRYVIANHWKSVSGDEFFKEALAAPPVKCCLNAYNLSELDTTIPLPEQLMDLESLESACEGHSDRFKLMRVAICDGILSLDFADLEEQKWDDRCKCHSFRFRDFSGEPLVWLEDSEHPTTHEFDFHGRDQYGFDKNGNRLIATFKECRGIKERIYSESSIILIDGRQYLDQNIYDY